jgi:hypothetical protein
MSNNGAEQYSQLGEAPGGSPEESLFAAWEEVDRLNLDLETARTALKNAQPLIDFVREQEALLYQGIRDQLAQLKELVPLLSQRYVYGSTHKERNRQIEVIIDAYCAFIRLNHSLLMALRDCPNTDGVRRPLYSRLLELYIPLSARPRYSDLEEDFRYIELDAVLSKKVSSLLGS